MNAITAMLGVLCVGLWLEKRSVQRERDRWKELTEKLKSDAHDNLYLAHELSRELFTLRVNGNGRSIFSESEIQTLIRLCHPDKHGNSPAANEMTAKLLSLRRSPNGPH
jgi:uncharacterized protein YcaQ